MMVQAKMGLSRRARAMGIASRASLAKPMAAVGPFRRRDSCLLWNLGSTSLLAATFAVDGLRVPIDPHHAVRSFHHLGETLFSERERDKRGGERYNIIYSFLLGRRACYLTPGLIIFQRRMPPHTLLLLTSDESTILACRLCRDAPPTVHELQMIADTVRPRSILA
jgi:hypothetical protein